MPALAAIEFSVLRFRLRFVESWRTTPEGAATLFRGALGHALRRLVCPDSSWDCAPCELQPGCSYAQLFLPTHGAPGSPRRLSDPPRPFVLRPEPRAGGLLALEAVLVGRAASEFPTLVLALENLGEAGLGRRGLRYRIETIETVDASDGSARPADPREGPVTLVVSDAARVRRPEVASRLRIRFLTPTEIKSDGDLVLAPSYRQIVERVRDRLSALARFFCARPLELDFQGIAERAEGVRTAAIETEWRKRTRTSSRTGQRHALSGFVGQAVYEGDLAETLPLLAAAQYLHVGKGAAFGNGRIVLEAD